MQLIKTLGVAAFITLATANSVEMVSQDKTDRTVKFVPQEGNKDIPEIQLKGGETKTATFPEHWKGNWYAQRPQDHNDNGMLGEVSFDNGGKTFFDVSAIVNKDDTHNVKMLMPKQSKSPSSGCQNFPCDNVYQNPDDQQTKGTEEKDLTCLIGDKSGSKRHPRDLHHLRAEYVRQ